MSLTVNGTAGALPAEGRHPGVCCALVDLGEQVSEAFRSCARNVLLGWEIPGAGERPVTLWKRYTASLNGRAQLRRDLAAWRGRDFTPAELESFDLRRVLGAGCLLEVGHREQDGTVRAVVRSVQPLPRDEPRPVLRSEPFVFDLDADPPEKLDALPRWIGELVRRSRGFGERAAAPAGFTELADGDFGDEELPF